MNINFKTLKNYFYIIIILATIILLFLSYNNNSYTDSSYKTLKYIEEYKNTNTINYYENSFNNIIVEKTFFYETMIGLLNKLLEIKTIQIILLLLFSITTLYLIYIISFKISESKTAAVLSLLLYTTSITFYSIIFTLNSYIISTPLILLYLYFIITKQFDWKKTFIISILLALLDFKSFFLIYTLTFSYFIYISKSEKTNSKITELNFILILTTIFFITITFRENLQLIGLKVLFQNLPLQLFLETINPKNILLRLYSSSTITLLLGVLGIIIAYTKKIEKSYIIIASFFTSLILLLLTKNNFYILFLSISSTILASFTYNYFLQFINLSKFKNYKKIIVSIVIILILTLNITQTITDFKTYKEKFSISKEKKEVYNIIKNDKNNIKVFCNIKDSYKTEYYTKKNTFINYDFNYVDTPNLFYNYYITLLEGKSNVEVINILKKYNIKYLILEEKPFYLKEDVIEKNCFKKIYDNKILLYEFTC